MQTQTETTQGLTTWTDLEERRVRRIRSCDTNTLTHHQLWIAAEMTKFEIADLTAQAKKIISGVELEKYLTLLNGFEKEEAGHWGGGGWSKAPWQ